jgi:uncharacterized protein YvpB
VDSRELIDKGTTSKVSEFSFTTVTTPSVKSYGPQGEGVKPSTSIRVIFDVDMNHRSVEDAFTIKPVTSGDINWEDDKTFVFKPTTNFAKDTKYEYSFTKGLLNTYGGLTQQPIQLSFTTVGKVNVAEVYPLWEQNNIDVNTTNITIKFNQEVDHQSVQDHFWADPGVVNGSISWDGNTMTYHTAGNLAFNTKYTFGFTKGITSVYGIDSDQDFTSAFTTRNNIIALGVPQYYQTYTSYVCNVVAAKMVLAYYGIYRDEYNDIIPAIGYGNDPNQNWVNYYGTHWGPIANYLNSQGHTAYAMRGMTVAQLTSEIDQGHPTIIWWYNERSQPAMQPISFDNGSVGYKGMHSSVVIGYVGYPQNPSYLLINDPWLGPGLWYQTDAFISQWSTFGYTGVVVY